VRRYIEFDGKQAKYHVFLIVSLCSNYYCLFTGSLDPENYPVRLSWEGWCGSKVRVV
jgi:hypothetical protein